MNTSDKFLYSCWSSLDTLLFKQFAAGWSYVSGVVLWYFYCIRWNSCWGFRMRRGTIQPFLSQSLFWLKFNPAAFLSSEKRSIDQCHLSCREKNSLCSCVCTHTIFIRQNQLHSPTCSLQTWKAVHCPLSYSIFSMFSTCISFIWPKEVLRNYSSWISFALKSMQTWIQVCFLN